MKFILLGLVILVSSCKNQKSLIVTDSIQDNELELLVEDGYFFTDSIETDVIRDEKTLKLFFSKVNKTRKPGIPIPKVNFEEEIALIVCMGEQREMGLPYLELVKNGNQQLVIGIKMEKSANGTSNILYPFCVYKMPITKKEVIFKEI